MTWIRLSLLSGLCLCLSGCFQALGAGAAIGSFVLTGYNTYDAVTERRQPPIVTTCEGWKKMAPSDGYRERWTESEIAQARNNNYAYLCTCEKRKEFCERKD